MGSFGFFPFLNEIFSAEKCIERILGVYLDGKFWIFSFLNEIFSAEKCPFTIISFIV
jgi:hypothetical protein